MSIAIVVFVCVLIGCSSSPQLKAGTWTGSLTPMNHPEINNSISYKISYPNDQLNIMLIGPNGTKTETREVYLRADTLFFTFDEPEEQVALNCALARERKGVFVGRCSDSAGKWARFTMKAPE